MEEQDYRDCEELGLSKNEAKVYTALVEFGKLSSVEISSKSTVSYGKIYNVLNSLISKGLVKVIPEKNKRFIPTDPEALLDFIEKKEKKLEKAKEIAKRLQGFYETKEKEALSISYGKKAFYRMIREHRKPKKYDYSIRWSAEFNPEWVREVEKEIKKKIDFKVLTRNDKETEENIKKWKGLHKNIREFENDGVAVSIIDDKEVLISMIKSNITMVIKDLAFVKMMRQLFLETYKNSKEIETKPAK